MNRAHLTVVVSAAIVSLFSLAAPVGWAEVPGRAQVVHYRCGSFDANGGTVYVSAYGISCQLALQLQRGYFLAPEDEKELVGPNEYNGYIRLKQFPGWHCTSGALAGGCRKGQLIAGYYDGPPEASTTPCGSLPINHSPVPGEHYRRVYLRAPLSVTCGKAKGLLRRYQDHHSGCQGSGCFVTYPDGWTCHTPSPGEWPLVMACEKGDATVEAHVKSKIKGPR